MSASPVPEGSTTPKEYVVQKILARRINEQGKREYFVKWSGCDDKSNTWKLEHDLDCVNLIVEFDMEKEDEEEREKNKRKALTTEKARPAKSTKEEKKVGFERGLAPERIIDVKIESGQIMLLILWEGTKEADLVPASQANVRCPQLVISFYEERLMWKSPSSKEEASYLDFVLLPVG